MIPICEAHPDTAQWRPGRPTSVHTGKSSGGLCQDTRNFLHRGTKAQHAAQNGAREAPPAPSPHLLTKEIIPLVKWFYQPPYCYRIWQGIATSSLQLQLFSDQHEKQHGLIFFLIWSLPKRLHFLAFEVSYLEYYWLSQGGCGLRFVRVWVDLS